jgi:hypothetical protein
MMPIKIECGCGQRYAFEIEPVNGQMPTPIACPACGTDGTSAANEIIAQQWTPLPVATLAAKPPPLPSAPAVRVTVPTAPSSPAPARRLPGQVSREQAEHEAKAKIIWGDSEQEVIGHLRINGFTIEEAQEIVRAAIKDRAATVRADGIRKIFKGIGLMCVPVVALITMASIGVILISILALAVMTGLYGLWLLANGILMALAPKSEKGDINDK